MEKNVIKFAFFFLIIFKYLTSIKHAILNNFILFVNSIVMGITGTHTLNTHIYPTVFCYTIFSVLG